LPAGGVTSIATDACDSNVVYVLMEYTFKDRGHLFRSNDGGANWSQIYPLGNINWVATSPRQCSTVIFNRSDSRGHYQYISRDAGSNWTSSDPTSWIPVSFAGQSDRAYGEDWLSILLSENGGESWDRLAKPGEPGWRIEALAVAPRTPDHLYAAAGDGNRHRFYRSTNGGAGWTDLGPAPNSVSKLVIDPNNDSVVYALVKFYESRDPVLKSTDGGAIWQPLP